MSSTKKLCPTSPIISWLGILPFATKQVEYARHVRTLLLLNLAIFLWNILLFYNRLMTIQICSSSYTTNSTIFQPQHWRNELLLCVMSSKSLWSLKQSHPQQVIESLIRYHPGCLVPPTVVPSPRQAFTNLNHFYLPKKSITSTYVSLCCTRGCQLSRCKTWPFLERKVHSFV